MKWTVKNSNLRPGDILLTRNNGFLPKAIRLWMEIYRRRLGLPKRKLYNHAAGVIEVWGELYVVEAIANGVNIRPFEHYGKQLETVKVLSPKKIYSNQEGIDYNKASQEFTFDPTGYDYFTFIYQMGMIVKTSRTGEKEWKGPVGKKAMKRMYCSELVASLANIIRPNTFDKPWSVNPLDIDLNKYYKEKIVSHD